jgi:hypothetical protein
MTGAAMRKPGTLREGPLPTFTAFGSSAMADSTRGSLGAGFLFFRFSPVQTAPPIYRPLGMGSLL